MFLCITENMKLFIVFSWMNVFFDECCSATEIQAFSKLIYHIVRPYEPDQPDPPLTRPCGPGGEPDPPLFTTLRDQPDSTRFLILEVGFNPIQPHSTRIKNFTFNQLQIFSYFFLLLQYYRSFHMHQNRWWINVNVRPFKYFSIGKL